jgi:hypothetical protein
MKIRTMLGLGAVGGLLYLHRKRGGEWTVDSLRDSARELWRGIERSAERARRDARDAVREGARQAEQSAQRMTDYGSGNGRH